SLQWHLHFEFVTSTTDIKGPSPPSEKEQVEWRAPSTLDIETMVWDLPVTILPTTPSQVAQACHSSGMQLSKSLHNCNHIHLSVIVDMKQCQACESVLHHGAAGVSV
ncbi:RAB6A-GEF complex partner protein 2-like 3, partial [Homarus americanus]